MLKTIALYNNKGGVSKTTTTFNLAIYLSKIKKKKILIIDADAQSNISELFFASDANFWDSVSETLPGDSIYDAMKPRLEGSASRVDVSKIKLCANKRYENLFLLRGDIRFSALAEGYYSSAVEQAITSNINQKNTYLSFRRMVRDFLAHHSFDNILFDLGPSTGAISRLALLACDGYFVPVTPDRFSALAVRSLPQVLKEWFSHDKLVLSTLPPYGMESDYTLPVFCGAISQQFQIHRGKIKKSYDRWNERIRDQLSEGFSDISALPKSVHLQGNPVVAEVENLGPVAPLAQMLGKAIFDISQEDTKHASSSGQMFYGAVFEPWKEKIKNYETEIGKLAKAIA
jgi:cellulose biosynthesis protein BcsQ